MITKVNIYTQAMADLRTYMVAPPHEQKFAQPNCGKILGGELQTDCRWPSARRMGRLRGIKRGAQLKRCYIRPHVPVRAQPAEPAKHKQRIGADEKKI